MQSNLYEFIKSCSSVSDVRTLLIISVKYFSSLPGISDLTFVMNTISGHYFINSKDENSEISEISENQPQFAHLNTLLSSVSPSSLFFPDGEENEYITQINQAKNTSDKNIQFITRLRKEKSAEFDAIDITGAPQEYFLLRLKSDEISAGFLQARYDANVDASLHSVYKIYELSGIISLAVKAAESQRQLNYAKDEINALHKNMIEGYYLAELVFNEEGIADDWKFLDVNSAHSKIIGIPREKIIGKRVREVFAGIEQEWMDVTINVALTGKPDHKTGYVEVTGRYFENFYYSPAPNRFVCIFFDVSEQIKLQAETERNEKLLKHLINGLDEILILKDINGNWLFRNQFANNMFGIEGALKENVSDKTVAGNNQDLSEYFSLIKSIEKQACEKRSPVKSEFEKDNSAFEITVVPLLNDSGETQYIIVNGYEISNSKASERALKFSEHRYKSLVETSSEGISLLSMDGNAIFLNRKMAELFGYKSPSELVHRYYLELIHEDDREIVKSVIPELMTGQKLKKISCRMYKSDGTIFRTEVNASLIYDEKGLPAYIMNVVRDVTTETEALLQLENIREFQNLLMNLALEFINLPVDSYDTRLNDLLKLVGEFYNGDRSYIVEYNFENMTMTNTHEWCKQGIPGFKDQVINYPLEGFEYYIGRHKSGKPVLATAPEILTDDALNRLLISLNVKTMITIPMIINGLCAGFVGFDSIQSGRRWNDEEVKLLKFVAEIVSNAKEKMDNLTSVVNETRRRAIIMEGSFDGVAVFSADHKIIEANQKFADMLGYEFSEITRLHTWDFEANLSKNEIISAFMDPLSISGVFETRHRRKDRTIFDVEVSVKGSMIGDEPVYLTITRDISKRKEDEKIQRLQYNIAHAVVTSTSLQELLRIVRKELSSIMDVTNFFVAAYDRTDDIFSALFFEDELDSYFEWNAPGSLSGLVINSRGPVIFMEDEILNMISSGLVSLEGTIPKIWMGAPLLIHDQMTGIIAVQSYDNYNAFNLSDKDVLEIVAKQISLYIEHKRTEGLAVILMKAFSQSQVMLVITDGKGKIEYQNPEFCEFTGLNSEMLKKYFFDDIIPVKGKEGSRPTTGEIIASRSDWSGDIELINSKREKKWYSLMLSAVVESDGKVPNCVAIMDDITERKKLLEEVIVARDKAEELNHLKNSFFANMSHELRTPLIGIIGYSEMLAENLNTDPELREMAQIIYNGGARLKNTVDFILAMSKLESGKATLDLRMKSINIVNEINEIFALYSVHAAKKKLEYTLLCEHKEVFILADQQFFHTIVNNILNNALKFTDRGYIRLSLNMSDGKALIEIEDSGCGIPNEMLGVIWEEFRQVSEGYNRDYEGTGLGLTIAKKYCELMGGTIRVNSKVGEGTRFEIVFPLEPAEFSDTADDQECVLNSAGILMVKNKTNVLYVEDDKIAVALVTKILEEKCSVFHAVDSGSAFRVLEGENIDLILMDINLRKGLDGAELTRLIKADARFSSIPVAAVTSYVMDKEINSFKEAGIDHYLAKPFTKNSLLTLISSMTE